MLVNLIASFRPPNQRNPMITSLHRLASYWILLSLSVLSSDCFVGFGIGTEKKQSTSNHRHLHPSLDPRNPAKALKMKDTDIEYTFHCYDHCPFGNRVAFLMDKHGIKYKKVVYGYGSGALPKDCEGEGYDGDLNPRSLTGKKQLPVLQGDGVPTQAGAVGMAESLEICSFLIGRHQLVVPSATGRSDLQGIIDFLLDKNVMNPLTITRLTKMPVPDSADKRDVSYHLWKHTKKGDLNEFPTSEEDAACIAKVNEKLAELPSMFHGTDENGVPCLNSWGWGMDDVLLLPWLRRLTCIKGIVYPKQVQEYMATVGKQVEDYSKHAI